MTRSSASQSTTNQQQCVSFSCPLVSFPVDFSRPHSIRAHSRLLYAILLLCCMHVVATLRIRSMRFYVLCEDDHNDDGAMSNSAAIKCGICGMCACVCAIASIAFVVCVVYMLKQIIQAKTCVFAKHKCKNIQSLCVCRTTTNVVSL